MQKFIGKLKEKKKIVIIVGIVLVLVVALIIIIPKLFFKKPEISTDNPTVYEFENYLKSKNYIPIQTKQILVKDFYKPITETSTEWKVFILGENQIGTN